MISTKGRYGLRVMIDLAQHAGAGYVPLKDIAERQDISKKYLEIIVRDLVSAGLLAGVSGRSGGYRLCKPPEETTAAEILEPLEGSLSAVACLQCGAPACPREAFCRTRPLWEGYDRVTRAYFGGIHLSDLLEDGRVF